MSSVLVFVGVHWCPHCQKFKPIWERLTQDKELTSKLYMKSFLTENDTEILPDNFSWIKGFPTILKVPLSEYGKAYNQNTNQEINRSYPITGKVYNGRERTFEAIKKWALTV